MKFHEVFNLTDNEKKEIENYLNLTIIKNNEKSFKNLLNEYLLEFRPDYLKQQSWYNFFMEILKEILLKIIFENAIKKFPEYEMNLTYLYEYYLSAIEIKNKEYLKKEINNLVEYKILKTSNEEEILKKLLEISKNI